MTKAGYEWGKALRSIEDYARKYMDIKEHDYSSAGERVLDIIDCVANLRVSNEQRILRMYRMIMFNYVNTTSYVERIYFAVILRYIHKISKSTIKEIEDYENEKNSRV